MGKFYIFFGNWGLWRTYSLPHYAFWTGLKYKYQVPPDVKSKIEKQATTSVSCAVTLLPSPEVTVSHCFQKCNKAVVAAPGNAIHHCLMDDDLLLLSWAWPCKSKMVTKATTLLLLCFPQTKRWGLGRYSVGYWRCMLPKEDSTCQPEFGSWRFKQNFL